MSSRLLGIGVLVALSVAVAPLSAAETAAVPQYVGTDWADPIVADPPLQKPTTESCTVRIVDDSFADYAVHTSDYTPPADCGTEWSQVVLTLTGSVAGRQYDRLGWLTIGDVPVLKTSTPEPSADGITWTVEKDLTDASAVLRSPQEVAMYLGNTVDETYTGIFDITVDLTFYQPSEEWPAAAAPETVQALSGETTVDGATTGTLTIPSNTERLLAQVYATGSGGGCEEFWYSAVPTSSPDDYWCKSERGPWREIEVYVDGRLAGIAMPYPHIYTGGWSNPYLWTTLPAPRAFDLTPLTVDLTPFVGTMTDGEPHQITTKVVGAEGDGWSVPTAYQSWQDEGSTQVTGAITAHAETTPTVRNTVGTDSEPRGDLFTADLTSSHQLTVTGYVDTSHGRVSTTVNRNLDIDTSHWWADGENIDGQTSTFSDTGFVRVASGEAPPRFDRWTYRFGVDGEIVVTDGDKLTTTLALFDEGRRGSKQGATRGPWERWRHAYDGTATWNYTIPREQRRPTARTSVNYAHSWSDRAAYNRQITTENGVVLD